MAAWEHLPCGTVVAGGKNPPPDCRFCVTLLVRVTKGKRQGWRRVDFPAGHLPAAEPRKRRPVSRTPRNRNISPAKRARIYERDQHRCVECGCDDPELLTIDHRVPITKGGTNKDDNLQTMCRPCNQQKADSLP